MTTTGEQPVHEEARTEIGGVKLLHTVIAPAKSKPWGCSGCKLFQYAPCFSNKDREAYYATLDPQRKDKKNKSYQIDGVGPSSAKIMVVLDSPSRDEDKEGVCAVGGGARIVKRNAREVGLNPDKFFFTYAVRCRGPEAPKMNTAVYCSKFLSMDIARIKPDVILALGSLPTQLLLGKPGASSMEYHCVPQTVTVAGHTCTVYPMWSPNYVLRNDYLTGKYLDAWE